MQYLNAFSLIIIAAKLKKTLNAHFVPLSHVRTYLLSIRTPQYTFKVYLLLNFNTWKTV